MTLPGNCAHFLRGSPRRPFDQVCHHCGPASLVTGANSGAIVAMEVFIEEKVVAPVRVFLHHFGAAENRTATIRATPKKGDETIREVIGYLVERQLLP